MASLGFGSYLSDGMLTTTDKWYVVRCVASLATLLILAFLAGFGKAHLGKLAVLATAIAASAAAAIAALGGQAQLGWAVALLGGCSVSLLMYIWLLLLARRSLLEIATSAITGAIVADALIVGISRIGGDIGAFAAIPTALIAGLSAVLLVPDLDSCAPDGPMNRNVLSDIPWFTLAAFVVCGFIATVVYGITQQLTWLYDWSPNYIAFGIAALAVIVATFTIMLLAPSWKTIVWIPQAMILAIALALSCFSIRESLQTSVGLLLASVFCSHFLHWAIFAAILSRIDAQRAVLSAILLLVSNNSLAMLAGNALGSSLPHSMQNLGGVAGIATLTLVALLSAAYLVIWLLRANEAVSESAKAATSIDAALESRLASMVLEYKLTPRESEVALLTALGFSGAYIAQKLVVSNSTVRFHQQNLYRKLGVHSRDDFIELTRVG